MTKKQLTEDEYVEKKMSKITTTCCNAKTIRKGRANLRCAKCDEDVTIEMCLLYQMYQDEYKYKQEKSNELSNNKRRK